MSVGLHFGGTLLTQRLVRIGVTVIGQQGCRHLGIHPKHKLLKHTGDVRTFGTGPTGENENGMDTDSPDPSPSNPILTRSRGSLFGRRQPLSPLERISRLLPQESLSPEVLQLRDQEEEEEEHNAAVVEKHTVDPPLTDTQSTEGPVGTLETPIGDSPVIPGEEQVDTVVEPSDSEIQGEGTFAYKEGCKTPTLPGERLLCFGELLIAEYNKKRRVEYKKMFQLKEGQLLQSSWGAIRHSDIAGRHAGDFVHTTVNIPILIRRASLAEYVLFMKRGPAIAYPKDASTMLMLMDVTEGDCVLESGSGSGAMSLFLSRAVGSKGRVVSVEVREDHHRRAVLNYKRWRTAWSLRRGEEWPDNVQFHNTDLRTASSLLAGQGFNSIALDMVNPHLALPTVTPHLHLGAVCSVYLANLTQVIDLLEGLRCSALPLQCEGVMEVQHREWLLAPAVQKDGRFCVRKAPSSEGRQEDEEQSDDDEKEETGSQENPPFGSVPYIARPHPEQSSHTAFLVKLRKCVK